LLFRGEILKYRFAQEKIERKRKKRRKKRDINEQNKMEVEKYKDRSFIVRVYDTMHQIGFRFVVEY
jgi:hypothetical protein